MCAVKTKQNLIEAYPTPSLPNLEDGEQVVAVEEAADALAEDVYQPQRSASFILGPRE
jgi:hypothetical protein